MSEIWDKFKWVLTHLAWFVAGIILLIDPKHIDEFAAQHAQWSALILAIWTALVGWASKPREMSHEQILQLRAMRSAPGQGSGPDKNPPPPPKRAA